MTWDAYNRRKEALREVLAIADRRREESTATELLAEVEGANHAFVNEAELLLDMQMNWYQHLSGQMDRSLSLDAEDLETVAINAWHEVAAQMPGARTLLDGNVDMPELQKAFAHEHNLLARAAGIPANHPDLAGHGNRIKETARMTMEYAPVIPDTPAGIFARIRETLAA